MNNSEELRERRKSNRLLAGDGIFAICKTGSSTRLGKVVDISRGGIAFQYLLSNAADGDLTKDPVSLEVFDKGSSCCLKEDACCIVYDFQMPQGNSVLKTFQLRLCGVKFGELSDDQRLQLDSLIHRQGFFSDDGLGVDDALGLDRAEGGSD